MAVFLCKNKLSCNILKLQDVSTPIYCFLAHDIILVIKTDEQDLTDFWQRNFCGSDSHVSTPIDVSPTIDISSMDCTTKLLKPRFITCDNIFDKI